VNAASAPRPSQARDRNVGWTSAGGTFPFVTMNHPQANDDRYRSIINPVVIEDHANFALAKCTEQFRGMTESRAKFIWEKYPQYNFERNDPKLIEFKEEYFPGEDECIIEFVNGHPTLKFHDPYMHACYKIHGMYLIGSMARAGVNRVIKCPLRTAYKKREGNYWMRINNCCAERIKRITGARERPRSIAFKTHDKTRATELQRNLAECKHFRSLWANLLWKKIYTRHRTTIAILGIFRRMHVEVTLRPGNEGYLAAVAEFEQCAQSMRSTR
jgi:hypothetical protein